jgi:hypothetical protein
MEKLRVRLRTNGYQTTAAVEQEYTMHSSGQDRQQQTIEVPEYELHPKQLHEELAFVLHSSKVI